MTDVEDIAPETSSPASPGERSGGRRIGILAGVVLALIAIGVVAALILSDGDSQGGPTRPAHYDVAINNGWPRTDDEKQVSGYLESAWRDPVGPTIAIDTRLADETGSPMANAELAQIQTSKLPGYRERGLRREKLGGRPVVTWGFDVSNEESGFELFFEECGTTFIVRGAMATIAFEAFARDFREITSSIKVHCDE
jgi:hypothetical protein